MNFDEYFNEKEERVRDLHIEARNLLKELNEKLSIDEMYNLALAFRETMWNEFNNSDINFIPMPPVKKNGKLYIEDYDGFYEECSKEEWIELIFEKYGFVDEGSYEILDPYIDEDGWAHNANIKPTPADICLQFLREAVEEYIK